MQACCAFWSDLDLKGLFFIPVTLQRYLLQKLLKWYLQFSSEFQNFVVSFVPFFLSSGTPDILTQLRLIYISRWSISCLMDSFFYWSEVIWVLSCSSICCVSVTRRLLAFALYIKIRDHSLLGHMVRVGLGGMVKRRKHSVVGILRKLRGMWNRNPELLVGGQTNNLVWAWLCWLWVIIKFF